MEIAMFVVHPFAPVYDRSSRILILGSLPSVRSRDAGFYYRHPQNRFWKVTAAVMACAVPQSVEEKKQFLLENGIALWDVIASCDVNHSSDSSIRNADPNDLDIIFSHADIRAVFTNGKTADRLYRRYFEKYQQKTLGMTAEVLPSTSPANAAWTLEKLVTAWQCIRI